MEAVIYSKWWRSGKGSCEKGDIPGRQSIAIVACVEYGAILSLILKKVNACFKWGKKEYKLNHLLFMDDLKM